MRNPSTTSGNLDWQLHDQIIKEITNAIYYPISNTKHKMFSIKEGKTISKFTADGLSSFNMPFKG